MTNPSKSFGEPVSHGQDRTCGKTRNAAQPCQAKKDAVFLGLGVRHAITETFTAVGEFVIDTPANTFSACEMFPLAGFQWEFNDAMFLDVIGHQGVGTTSDVCGFATAHRFEF